MTQEEPTLNHSFVCFAILSWECRQTFFTPAWFPLFCVVLCQIQIKSEEFYRRLHEFEWMFCATCHELWPSINHPPAGQEYQ